jgi:hypothetical protein
MLLASARLITPRVAALRTVDVDRARPRTGFIVLTSGGGGTAARNVIRDALEAAGHEKDGCALRPVFVTRGGDDGSTRSKG